MAKRREINIFSIAFLDLISGALGAVIILYVAVPKHAAQKQLELAPIEKTISAQEAANLQKMIQTLEQDKAALTQEVASLSQQIRDDAQVEEELRPISDAQYNIGFRFKGKKILFIIDVSGSMVHEDRMGQVKAGLKMFVTSLTPDYSIDIIFYPDGTRALYRSLWGFTQEMSEKNKREVYQYLNALFPFGATPTRDVLRSALTHYRDATDIVLLSDGAPTLKNSSTMDNIPSLLEEIKNLNYHEVQINAIGVGSDMVATLRTPKYDFLNQLAKQHNGFFHPF